MQILESLELILAALEEEPEVVTESSDERSWHPLYTREE